MTKNKGTQNSEIRDQTQQEHKTEKNTGQKKNKTITYANTEPKAQENAQADRQ